MSTGKGRALRFRWEDALRQCPEVEWTTRAVALTLATYADAETGRRIFPSLSQLARATGTHRSTWTRHVAELARLGWLALDGTGPGGQNAYRLTIPELGPPGADPLPLVSVTPAAGERHPLPLVSGTPAAGEPHNQPVNTGEQPLNQQAGASRLAELQAKHDSARRYGTAELTLAEWDELEELEQASQLSSSATSTDDRSPKRRSVGTSSPDEP